MSQIRDNKTVRSIRLHAKARDTIKAFAKPVRQDIGELLLKLQVGISIGMPYSRPMPSVSKGVHELRLKNADGLYRVFYYLKSEQGILVFHAFTKKTQKTPQVEIELAKKRLKEII